MFLTRIAWNFYPRNTQYRCKKKSLRRIKKRISFKLRILIFKNEKTKGKNFILKKNF